MHDEPEKTFEHYRNLLGSIQNEMMGQGIASIVVLHESNPITHQSVVHLSHRGESFLLRGMADFTYGEREKWGKGEERSR